MASVAQRRESRYLLATGLQATLGVIPAYTWYTNPSGGLAWVNQRQADYLGLPQNHCLRLGTDMDAEWDSHIAFLHPDDRDETRRVWSTCIRTGSAAEIAFRVRNAEGQFRWFLSRAEPLRGNDGTVLYWVGINLDIEERKRAEDALRANEESFRLLVNTIPGLVAIMSAEGEVEHVNHQILEYFGKGLDELKHWATTDVVHPDDLPYVVAAWRRSVQNGTPYETEQRLRRADGVYRWFQSRGSPLRDSAGRVVRWHNLLTDITDRKRAEEALQQSQFYLAEGQRLAHMGSWVFEPAGFFDFWSRELFHIYGLDPAQKPPSLEEYLAQVHPEDREFMASLIIRMVAEASGCDVTKRIVRPNGELRYIRCVGIPVVENSKLQRIVGTAVDVTEQELLTQELRLRETYLAEAQRLTHTGSWVWNVADRSAAHLSEEWYRIYGFDPAQGSPGWEKRLERVHPEDRAKWKGTIERAILEKADYEVDFRIVLPNNTIKWIYTVGHPVVAESGELLQFLGSSTDITERKTAEEKIREQEAELRQMLDLTPQYLGVLGPDGTPLYANRASLEYLGMSLDEWQQRRAIGDDVHPDDVERLARASSSGSAYELELRVRNREGAFRWILSRFNPLYDQKGQISRWYVASTDIDDRKRAEEKLQQENVALREEIAKASMFEDIVGTSPALRTVLSLMSKVAPSDSTVLITGETGTGKELVARAIHRRSDRASRPFVSVNCAAIPRDLIASELFGHEKGAFTGATQQRLGRFELANGGTLFLDEVGELPTETQIALLRVLQEHEFERVGGTRQIRADVRVIAATNRDLVAAIHTGSFRSDLFYRLNVFPIETPSLRERKEDIPLLVEYFIDRYARKAGKSIRRVNKKTLELLQSYPWPGNIRELQNVIERSVILSETEIFTIDENWLPRQPLPAAESKQHLELPRRLETQAKDMIEAALRESRGRVFGPTGAAAKLGIPRSTLESKIRSLNINKNRFKV